MSQPSYILAGRVRVLELGAAIASPFCCALLADAGAEVYKIETERRPDNLRANWPMAGGEAGLDRSYYYNLVNRGKRGLTLDLTKAEGRAAFLDLVRLSDVVVENFTAGTMHRLGLPYDVIRRANPSIVMLSLSGFGATGPSRDHVAYGPLLEAVTGMANLGGYRGGPPTHSAFVFTDYCSAMYGAVLVLSALHECMETGRGCYFDISQAEVALNLIPDAVHSYGVNGVLPGKQENRDAFVSVHGVYPCQGNDQWIVVAARTDDDWRRLCRAMGSPAWTRRAEFATPASRAAHAEDLDKRIARWTKRWPREEAIDLLQRHGVASGHVNTIADAVNDPHLQARGAYQVNRHPVVGDPLAYASPFNISGMPRAIRHGAPLWGQHNDLVTRDLVGLTHSQAAALTAAQALR